MNWDEAVEYWRYLNRLYEKATTYLSERLYISHVKESQAHNPDGGDNWGVMLLKYGTPDYETTPLLKFIDLLIGQLEKLAVAMDDAKHNASVDICQLEKEELFKQRFTDVLSEMLDTDETEIDAPLFERDEVIELYKKYSVELRQIRSDIAIEKMEMVVEYTPPLEYGRTLNEILSQTAGSDDMELKTAKED